VLKAIVLVDVKSMNDKEDLTPAYRIHKRAGQITRIPWKV